MNETPDPVDHEPLDLDAWLDGAQRTEHTVTLYGRNDLLADIDTVQAELRVAKAMDREAGEDPDRALSDSSNVPALQQRLDALYEQLDASKMQVRISFLGPEEQDEIREATVAELKDEMDAAADKGRRLAQEQAKREGIKSPADLNAFIRNTARAAANAVLEREVSIRTIAKAVVSPPMNVEQVRRLYAKVGDAQIGLLSTAYKRALVEAPVVTVPKSRQP